MTRPDEGLLREVPLFSGCSDVELATVARLAEQVRVQAGAIILPNPACDEMWYVVLAGRARVLAGGKEVSRLGPGEPFGDLAMVEGEALRPQVEALTEMTLVAVPAARLGELFTIGSIASVALQDLAAGFEQS
jgi:CRP-like cAMP-binding protein